MLKLFIVCVLLGLNISAHCQLNINAPSQWGNYNTQNNYMQPRLTEDNKEEILNEIRRIEKESKISGIKYFHMQYYEGANSMQVLLDIASFLKNKGYIDKSDGNFGRISTKIPMGCSFYLDEDSTLQIQVGQIAN